MALLLLNSGLSAILICAAYIQCIYIIDIIQTRLCLYFYTFVHFFNMYFTSIFSSSSLTAGTAAAGTGTGTGLGPEPDTPRWMFPAAHYSNQCQPEAKEKHKSRKYSPPQFCWNLLGIWYTSLGTGHGVFYGLRLHLSQYVTVDSSAPGDCGSACCRRPVGRGTRPVAGRCWRLEMLIDLLRK